MTTLKISEWHRGAVDDVKTLIDIKDLSDEVERTFTQLSSGIEINSTKINITIQSVENSISQKTSALTLERFRKCLYGLADQITMFKREAA